MKAFAAAALLLFAVSATADEASDARVAELEARIKSLERQVARLTVLLEAATSTPRAATPPAKTEGDAPAAATIAPPPLVIATPQETIRDEIRFQCMQRQAYQLATGGTADYGSC